jgi:hypothetical protein
MKNSTVINYIDFNGDEQRMVVATHQLRWLATVVWAYDFMPYCNADEKAAIMLKVNEMSGSIARPMESPESLWGAY